MKKLLAAAVILVIFYLLAAQVGLVNSGATKAIDAGWHLLGN